MKTEDFYKLLLERTGKTGYLIWMEIAIAYANQQPNKNPDFWWAHADKFMFSLQEHYEKAVRNHEADRMDQPRA